MNNYLKNQINKIDSIYREYTVFFALSGIGDICYCFYALNSIKAFHKKKIAVFTKPQYSEFINCFKEIDEVVLLEDDLIDVFCMLENEEEFSFSDCFDTSKHIFYCSALKEETYRQLFLEKGNVNLNKLIQLECEKHIKPFKPTFPEVEEKNITSVSPDSKTIIINPYSNSMKLESLEPFQKIADNLNKKGYTLYTNVLKDQAELNGTKRLECSLSEFYNLCKKVGAVISIRSGIIDSCVGSGAEFIVLYKDMWNGLFKKAYSLEGWGSQSNIIELDLSDEKLYEKIDNIF